MFKSTIRPSIAMIESPAYYTSSYLKTVDDGTIRVFEDPNFFLAVSLDEDTAVSMASSPFGSILSKKHSNKNLIQFLDEVKRKLKDEGIRKLTIKHPVDIYDSFVDQQALIDAGLELVFSDVNQHLHLADDWLETIHQMQQRKIRKLKEEGFEFTTIPTSELKMVYDFLNLCRQFQGLNLNVSYQRISQMFQEMPGQYDCFGVFRQDKISAACISVRVTSKIAYYFLPGTSPLFRSHSPMVLLIAGMVAYYKEQNLQFLDLGVSSIQGKPQETLRLFKQRMGAQECLKSTFTLDL